MVMKNVLFNLTKQNSRSHMISRTLNLKIWADVELIEVVSESFAALLYRPIAVTVGFFIRLPHEGLPDVEVLGVFEVGVPES